MEMPGGGPFKLMPGQVTDDSEMALHMLRGLMCYDKAKPLS
jgi:ADP-ribosylglycohydrolase